jgi:hypothetical protein
MILRSWLPCLPRWPRLNPSSACLICCSDSDQLSVVFSSVRPFGTPRFQFSYQL